MSTSASSDNHMEWYCRECFADLDQYPPHSCALCQVAVCDKCMDNVMCRLLGEKVGVKERPFCICVSCFPDRHMIWTGPFYGEWEWLNDTLWYRNSEKPGKRVSKILFEKWSKKVPWTPALSYERFHEMLFKYGWRIYEDYPVGRAMPCIDCGAYTNPFETPHHEEFPDSTLAVCKDCFF